MRRVLQKIEVHPFEKKIQQPYDLAKKEMSAKNFDLFQRYDMAIIVNLTIQINKDLYLVTKDEINKLVYNIMNNHYTRWKRELYYMGLQENA